MNTKVFFFCGEGSNLTLGTGMDNKIFFLRSVIFFSPNCEKITVMCKEENHYPPRWICITHIWSFTVFLKGIIIFQGVLTKFNFLMKFPH